MVDNDFGEIFDDSEIESNFVYINKVSIPFHVFIPFIILVLICAFIVCN